jgi:hypothetical protein
MCRERARRIEAEALIDLRRLVACQHLYEYLE